MKKLICIMFICLLLVGCKGTQKAEKTVFAMDTVMQLSVWGKDAQRACDELETMLLQMQKQWSADALNAGPLTAQHLALMEKIQAIPTAGGFDMQMYGVMQAWGFDTGAYRIPTDQELADAPKLWDLGAAVKGYAGDQAVELLKKLDVDCAILNLGGNVQTYGTKADGTPWSVGIRDPWGKQDYIGVVSVEGTKSVVTSGDYQRYFEENGVRYHHIMDPQTGRPADSGLRSVTVICENGLKADIMSTTLFALGLEKGAELWRESGDFEAVFVLADGRIFATQGVSLSECSYEVLGR